MPAAGAGQSVGHDLGVAELARRIARAQEQDAVHHGARADAGADEDRDEALDAAAGSEAILPPSGGANVVLHVDGQAEDRFDLVAERHVLPLEVRSIDDRLGFGMDLAGGSDTDTGDTPGIGGIEQPADDALEIRQDSRGAFPGLGLHLETPDKLSFGAQEAATQLAAAEVNADGIAIRGHRWSRRGG